MAAYDSDDCTLFSEALARAWAMYLRAGRLTSRNLDVVPAALTYGILQAAADGQRDARGLALMAYRRVAHFEVVVRRQRYRTRAATA